MIAVYYFGRLGDEMGLSEERLSLPDLSSISAIKFHLEQLHDRANVLSQPSIKTMINQEFVHGDVLKADHTIQEVGFLPPVGGG